jgi:hypothetical protein
MEKETKETSKYAYATARYLLFAGNYYYPSGGAKDLVGSFSNLDEAIDCANKTMESYKEDGDCWAHILCIKTLKIVKSYSLID